jgi:hypothetical protein
MRFKDQTEMTVPEIVDKLMDLDLFSGETGCNEDFYIALDALCKDDTYENWEDLQQVIQKELLADERFNGYLSQNYRIFYHGTSGKVAEAIKSGGIKLHKLGEATGDFNGSGSAFYVTNDLEQAEDWPKRDRKSGADKIVVFKVSKAALLELEGRTYNPEGGWKFYSDEANEEFDHWIRELEFRGEEVIDDQSKWEWQIRRGRSNEPDGGDMSLDYIEGPMCGTTGNIESATKSLSKTGHQLAICSRAAAEVFNKGEIKIVGE